MLTLGLLQILLAAKAQRAGGSLLNENEVMKSLKFFSSDISSLKKRTAGNKAVINVPYK
jgi:hypothetical protein